MHQLGLCGMCMLFAYAYIVLMIYVARWIYVFQGFEKLDIEEKAEPVTLKDLWKKK